MMHELVLAIDIGLSWCKAAFLDRHGNLVATGRIYTRSIPSTRDGIVQALWAAVVGSVHNAQQQLPPGTQPRAIAISSRGEFGYCLDAQGRGFWPMWRGALARPSIYYEQAYAPEIWQEKDPFYYGYAIQLTAIVRYLKAEHPHDYAQIHRIGALRDYLVYRLAGVWVTDPTSGPGEDTTWPDEIIALTGLPHDAFAAPLPPHQIVGGLLTDASQALNIPIGTPVVTGLHDGAGSSLGARAIAEGDVCLTLGSNFVLRAVTGQRLTARSFSYSILPGRWAWVNNVPKASAQLDILAEMLHEGAHPLAELHSTLGALAEAVPPGCNGLVIERIVAGQEEWLRQQVRMAQAAGHEKGVIYRAMMETIGMGVLELAQRSRHDGATLQRFIATGGGVHNRPLLHLLAAMLGAPIEVAEAEAGLIGAGIAAAVGSGWYATLPEAMAAMTSPGSMIAPDPAPAEYYRAVFPS